MWRLGGLLLACSLVLADCTPHYAENPISKNDIATVIAEIKWEIGIYQQASLYYSEHRSLDPSFRDTNGNPINHLACGDINNTINFYVSKVGVELTTNADNTVKGNLSVTFPIAAIAGTVAPTVSPSTETASTEKLDFVEYPVPPVPGQTPAVQYTPGQVLPPIANALFNLRGALILGALSGPCFTGNPGPSGPNNHPFLATVGLMPELEAPDTVAVTRKPPARPVASAPAPAPAPAPVASAPALGGGDKDAASGDTVTLGITVTDTLDGGVNVTAAIVKAGVEGIAKSVSGNTITVTFAPTSNEQFFQ